MSMFDLELYTFLILVEFLLGLYAITAFLVYVVRRHVMHLMMSFSFLASLASFILLHTYIQAPDSTAVVAYNFFFMLSSILIIGAFRSYYRLRIIPWRYYLFWAAGVFGIYFFMVIYPSYIARVCTSSVFLMLIILDALIEARPAILKEQARAKQVVFSVMGGMLGFYILRIILVFFLSDPESTLFQTMESTALTSGFFSIFTFNFWLVGSMLLHSDRIVNDLQSENQKMEDLAMLDPLSKLYNRHKLEEDLDQTVDQSNRRGDIASILLMDIDHFKQINDKLGHDAGDLVLIGAANIIASLLRADDKVYRWGGDEFMILAPHTDIRGAARLAQRIIEKFSMTNFPIVDKVSVSVGCAQHFQYESKAEWFKRVDLTLYKAKQGGRNRYEVWANDDLLPAVIAKLTWSDLYASGHEVIDNQHKNLLRLSNELYDRLGSSDSLADVDEILDRVLADLSDHFIYETNLMASMGFPLADEHKRIHKKLLNEYAIMRDQLKQGTVNLGAFFNFVSVRIVAEHIIKEDTKFFTYYKSLQS